jgi:hypothetical protein
MRLMPLVTAALILCTPGPSIAQDWIEYASRPDAFTVNFPGQPKVQDITYATEFGITLPGRVHIYEDGKSRYSVTVVDYGNAQKIHAERLKNCQAYPNLCNNPYIGELRGALDYAAWSFIKRDAKTFVMIHMHENRLYILEGTVPVGAPPPGLFQQSLGFLDKDGIRVRYDTIYANGYPSPTRVQYGQQAQGQQGR